MLTATVSPPNMPHEIVEEFQSIGLPLNKKMENMLNEEPEHQRPRRGCGYTQASRHLAEYINQPRGLTTRLDLRLFSEAGQRRLGQMVTATLEILGRLPKDLDEVEQVLRSNEQVNGQFPQHIETLHRLRTIGERLAFEESQLVANIVLSLLGFSSKLKEAGSLELPHYSEKLAIGTCPEAERYFLEFSAGYLRRKGIINIFVDQNNQPVIIEKISVGDSHSCITVADLILNSVHIPAGSLLGTTYSTVPLDTERCADMNGSWLPIDVTHGFRFLRLTTLSVSPENRARAFSNHLKKQLEGSPFFDPLNASIADLRRVALKQCPRNIKRS
ncbi:hypothetical protein TDB9533_04568 [Thalassocella blandensis]|nr:hypothetical protein TDB9533_04568 [Thalassocella blandensis]